MFFGINRGSNGRDGAGIPRSGYRPVHLVGHSWPADRDVAHGRRALDIVVYNETAGPAGGHLGVSLGGCALTYRAGMGTGSDLAIFRILMFIFRLAPAFMVACDINHIMRACVPEHPAGYRGNCHSVDYRPVFRSSSSSGLSFRTALPRCEMAFFSSPVNWATVFFISGTKKIGS